MAYQYAQQGQQRGASYAQAGGYAQAQRAGVPGQGGVMMGGARVAPGQQARPLTPGRYAQPGRAGVQAAQAPRVVGAGGYGQPRVAGAQPQYGQPQRQPQPQYAQAQPQYAQAQPQRAAMPGMAAAVQPVRVSPEMIQNVSGLLENRTELKTAVVKAFKHVAGANKTIDINGLIKMRRELSQKLNIPESIFGSIEDEYVRFDFDGSGFLEANEVYKLAKWHLYEFLNANGAGSNTSIPTKSLAQAGYQTTKELGAGNQAVVKLACDRYGNQRCVKCYKKAAMQGGGGNLQEMQEEFETMQLLACKNIARTFEIFQDAQFVYMVNEVYMGGDLTGIQQAAESKGIPVNEDWWRVIFKQCFEALQFMSQQAMMHCDIKEPNLMLRNENYAEPQVVLIDFGVSKAMTAKDTGSCSGTPGYMPPETMNTGKWYPGGDVFSMGVAMMQLLTNRVPDEDKARQGIMIGIFLEGCRDIEGVKQAVNSRQPPYHLMPPNMPGARQLVMRCLEKNLRSRPKAPNVLKDPWFGSITSKEQTPVEKAMMPQHPMATVGITEEMMNSVPGTMAISADAMRGR